MRMVPALVREYLGVCQSSVQTFDANLEHHSDMGGVRRQQQESRMRTVGSQPNDGRVHDGCLDRRISINCSRLLSYPPLAPPRGCTRI